MRAIRRPLPAGLALAASLIVLLASLAPAQERKKHRPAKPAPQNPPQKQKPPELDPATEADRVTATADNQAERREEKEKVFSEHFHLCDLDGNEWISFREAEATLGIDRAEFRRYDADQDGRIDALEFRDRSQALLTLLGAIQPPKPKVPEPDTGLPPASGASANAESALPWTPADLLAHGDGDGSGGLQREELERLFAELGAPLQVELVLTQNDADGSSALEEAELGPLATAIPRRATTSPDPAEAANRSPRGRGKAGVARPFQRLDVDGDGAIDEDDLRACLGTARVEVRLAGVLGALDRDGDRRLCEAEFLAALRNERAQ